MTPARRPGSPLRPRDYLILLLLAERPTYGVDLMEQLEARSQGSLRLNAGSLYRTIAALVDAGFVEPLREEAPDEGVGAPRKIYGLTSAGREALADEARRQAQLLESVRALDLLGDSG